MKTPEICPECEMYVCICGTVFHPHADKHVESVRAKLKHRMEVGLKKYGVTTERTDLSTKQWLIHAQEEALDLAVYLERLIQDTA